MPRITVREASDDDLDRIEDLLAENDLPYEDVRTEAARFFVATTEAAVVGAGGLESHGPHALVRSLVVSTHYRGRGYGSVLYDALEDHARSNAIDSLYLLTTTAESFFEGFGYRVVDRASVPDRIQWTPQFAELCPSSATCMHKPLR